MSLGDKQKRFARLIPRLIDEAHCRGFEVTLGDAFRDPRSHGPVGKRIAYGAAYSCHKLRLAIDLNLFKDGKYLTASEDHRQLGEWWEKQDPDACWGGRFNDGNHYSFTHEGMK